jgi:hypothetical protein
MSATQVDDPLEGREVVAFRNRFVAALAQSDHGALKQCRLLRVIRQPVEAGAPKNLVKGGLAALHRIRELPKSEIGFGVHHVNEVAGTWTVGPQGVAYFRQVETTGLDFPEHAFGGEKPHHPIERIGI